MQELKITIFHSKSLKIRKITQMVTYEITFTFKLHFNPSLCISTSYVMVAVAPSFGCSRTISRPSSDVFFSNAVSEELSSMGGHWVNNRNLILDAFNALILTFTTWHVLEGRAFGHMARRYLWLLLLAKSTENKVG